MARTALTPSAITIAGLNIATLTAANVDGHSLTNNGRQCIRVKNASGSAVTVTVVTATDVGGRAVADDVIIVPATTGDVLIGPFDPTIHNQKSGDDRGKVHINFSAVTTVTCAAYTLP